MYHLSPLTEDEAPVEEDKEARRNEEKYAKAKEIFGNNKFPVVLKTYC